MADRFCYNGAGKSCALIKFGCEDGGNLVGQIHHCGVASTKRCITELEEYFHIAIDDDGFNGGGLKAVRQRAGREGTPQSRS